MFANCKIDPYSSRINKIFIFFILSVFVLNVSKGQADKNSVNVRIYGGVNGYKNSQWNNWNVTTGTSNVSSGLLRYADGSASTVSAVLSNPGSVGDNGVGYSNGSTMCPDTVLRYASYLTVGRTLTISGLNNSTKYNLEFYASRSRTDGQKTIFVIGSKSVTVLTDNNLTVAAVFTGISPTNGSIVVNINRGTTWTYLNGFKITAVGGNQSTGNTWNEEVSSQQLADSIADVQIQVFPNPSSDHLTILSPGNHAVSIEFFDINGRRLLSYRNIFYQHELSLKQFPKGSYVIAVTDEKTRHTIRKIIIKD